MKVISFAVLYILFAAATGYGLADTEANWWNIFVIVVCAAIALELAWILTIISQR